MSKLTISKPRRHTAIRTGLTAFALQAFFLSSVALAYEPINRGYQTLRSHGMGGTRVTSGLYSDNFFSNPARATENPTWKLTVFDLTAETNSSAISNVNNMSGGSGDTLQKLASTTGSNNYVKLQTAMPALYLPNIGRYSLAIAMVSSSEGSLGLRRSYRADPSVFIDVGPAVTVARRFLPGDRLSVGVTTHFMYRIASKEDYSLIDFIKGRSFRAKDMSGEGAGFDFDTGGTYNLPGTLAGFDFQTGASVTNLLGGGYHQFKTSIISDNMPGPRAQKTALHMGISARRPGLLIFRDFMGSFELTDIGNNANGSLFRLVHMGAEAKLLSWFVPRVGISQGYMSAGFGFDLPLVKIDLATWGEELSLNAGGFEDRRYGLRIAFEI